MINFDRCFVKLVFISIVYFNDPCFRLENRHKNDGSVVDLITETREISLHQVSVSFFIEIFGLPFY